MLGLPARPGQPQLSHAELQRGTVLTEARSSTVHSTHHPMGLFKNSLNVPSLGFFKRIVQLGSGVGRPAFQVGKRYVERRSFGKNHGALDDVLQFTNVAWPVVLGQRVHGLCRNRANVFVHLARELLSEMTDQ